MRADFKTALLSGVSLLTGIAIGGYLFAQTQRRPVLSLRRRLRSPLRTNELMGLLGSVAINKFSGWLPRVVLETDRSVAIRHPNPKRRFHYVVIPKKDIANIGAFGDEDREYLIDSFAVIQELIEQKRLTDYEVLTNGPGHQTVTYLHFHLMSD